MDQIVYRAIPGKHAAAVLRLLQKNGLHPRLLAEAEPDATTQYVAKGTYTVPIAVPPEEAAAAARLLRARDRQRSAELAGPQAQFRRQLLAALVLAVLATLLVGWLRKDGFGDNAGEAIILVLLGIIGFGFVALIAIAQLTAARRRLRQSRPTGWKRWVSRLLLVGIFDAPFTTPDPPQARSQRRRKHRR
jgi:hypothetical protein